MTERVELYARRDSPGTPLPFNLLPTPIPDNSPLDHEIRDAARSLLKRQSGGALQMLAEDINIWLGGMLLEEDPKTAEGNKTGGGDWHLLVRLVESVWGNGMIPPKLRSKIIILIPKGRGDYPSIRLLELIWKILEKLLDQRLNAIVLHESLHGCWNGRGTGTAIIKAKLAQQLAHLEQQPFFSIFLDLQKAFDAMDCKRCLQNLRGLWHRPEHDLPHQQLMERGNYGMSGLGELWEAFSGRPWSDTRRPTECQARQPIGRCSSLGIDAHPAERWRL